MTSRKFNIGRLNEQLMNEKLFNVFNMIKYLGNGNVQPQQERQAEIANGSLWNDTNENKNVLKSYDSQGNIWNTLFSGYYHPANITTMPVNPVEGQVWIDGNGVIRYYQDLQWKVASALNCNDAISTSAGLENFLIIPQMTEVPNYPNNYLVPSISLGRLFKEKDFIDRSKYDYSDVSLSLKQPTTNKLAWVHVNPTFMYNARKRLIRINKEGTDAYKIGVPTNNTEFYGFNFGDPFGKLLTYVPQTYGVNEVLYESTLLQDTVSDYVPVTGGIKLINEGQSFDYVYAITYVFDDVTNKFGSMITDTVKIGTKNQVYVGAINDDPILFLNGLYLEQAHYTYNQTDGVITFNGEEITEYMDMVVLSFNEIMKNQGSVLELEVTNNHIVDNNIVISHNAVNDVANFENPVVFISGVSTSIKMQDQINITGDTVTIYNFGPIEENNSYSLVIVDAGTSYMSSGIVTDNAITDENIKEDGEYIVFVNGICMSPREFEISNGQILISGNLAPQNGQASEYYLMDLSNGDEGTQIMFDAPVSYFTCRINNRNNNVVYNDNNMVVSYAVKEDGSKNGILIDENFIKVPLDTENAYVTGQILNIKSENELGDPIFDYYIYNMNGDYRWTKFEDEFSIAELNTLKDMITQFSGNGSLSIMSNTDLQGCDLTYYAYTFIDEVDEPLVDGKRNMIVNVEGHVTTPTQDFFTTKMQTFYANKGCLSVYMNGIQLYNVIDYPSAQCKFTIDTPLCNNFINWNGRDLYDILKTVTDSTTVDELEALGLEEYAFNEKKKDYMITLAEAIRNMETTNELYYIVERMEQNETYACNKVITGPENRYDNFDNTYTSSSYIGPGAINIYLNGVLLERSEYSIFDNRNIILHEIQTAGGSDEWNRDDQTTWTLIKFYTEDSIDKIYCKEPDVLLIELRQDTSIKKVSYNIKETSYETQSFDIIDYDFPTSLKNTKDKIKIYINGLLYTGKYTNMNGVITLEDAPLKIDPIKLYFDSHPDTYREWKKLNGEYVPAKDRVTFEWR